MFSFTGYTDAKWFERPMRWAQLTLTDDDPSNFDPDYWLDYFTEIKAQGAVLSSGGYIAYYPSELPLHYVSPYLAGRDVFGYLVEGCRKKGMAVICRSDPHAVHDEQKLAHPEWIASVDGANPRAHWAMPGAWITCALGPYNFDFMTKVNNEIVGRYGVDGVFANRWAGSGLCRCENCRKLFRERKGKELPKELDLGDPAYADYVDFVQERLFELCTHWDGEIRKINPHARFIPNSGGGALSGLDMKWLGDFSSILFADRQARSGLMPPWSNGKNGKEFRAVMGDKPIGGIFSMGIEEDYRWKDSVQTEAELRIWVAEGTAHGLRPWFTKFCGKIYDKRWTGVVSDLYNRYADWEPHLRGGTPLARVGLVYSQATAKYYGGKKAHKFVEDPILGAYHALTESRILFEMVHEADLASPARLAAFKVLILPNLACMSEAQCAGITAFVQAGGSVVATMETSLYDERGKRRADFGLAGLFGVKADGKLQGPMQNSYLRLDSVSAHPVLKGFSGTERIINGAFRQPVRSVADFTETPVTLVPSYPDLPMEEVFPRDDNTGISELYLRFFGKGRVAYLPWDIDRIFWEVMAADHLNLYANIVRWAADGDEPVGVAGSGVIDVAAWALENEITVHLVNLGNPMMMKGPFRELLPSPPQTVSVRLPDGMDKGSIASVRLLAAGMHPSWTLAEGRLSVTVPSVLDHEVVVVSFKKSQKQR